MYLGIIYAILGIGFLVWTRRVHTYSIIIAVSTGIEVFKMTNNISWNKIKIKYFSSTIFRFHYTILLLGD